MKAAKFLSTVLLMALCGCSGSIGNIATNSDSNIEFTHTATSIPTQTITSTPYPDYDTIYFWWRDGYKNVEQLWELTPYGESRVLYEFAPLQSPEEALNSGHLTEKDLKVLEQIPAIHDPNSQFNGQQLMISSQSLEISSDRHRIAWHEKTLYYCVDSITCVYGYIIRVFNTETGKLESSISIPVEQETIAPIWSPDSKKLAFYTKQNEADSTNNIIHILDIDTDMTTDIVGVVDNYPYSGRFKWTPDSNGIVLSNGNGLFLITLNDQKINHIFSPNNWWIFDIAISPKGNFVLFTGIKDVDDPTTPDSSIDNMSYSNQLLYLFDLNTNTLHPVNNENELGWVRSIYWVPDGRFFIYLHANTQTELFLRNIQSNEIIMDTILPFEVDDTYSWEKSQLSKDGNSILFRSGKYDENTSLIINSLIVYDLTTKVWTKVLLPAEIQRAWGEEKGLNKYFLGFPTW